ncbi:MAG: hypothetical protein IT344_00445 [Candidatus Dadabacteria bacterium]|nr:hypothetical protein [Candidatus Dadabacteria bacterium]
MNLKHFLFTFRIKSAIKITLGGFICLLVGNVFHLESAYLSVLFLYLIMLMCNGQTFIVGIQCLAGGVAVGALSLLIANVFVQSGIVYLLLMGSLIFLIMLLLGKYFLPALLSAIVASMSMFVVIFESLGQASVTIENYLIQMFLGVFTAWIIDELIWPRRSEAALYTTLGSVYRDFSRRFAGLADGAIASRGEDAITLEVFNNLVNLVDRTGRESRGGAFYPEPFMKLTAYAKGVYIRLDVLEDFMSKNNKCLEVEEVKKVLHDIFPGLSSEFDGLARAVESGSGPPAPDAGLGNASSSLGALYMKLHEVEGDRDYFEDLLALGALPPLFDGILTLLKDSVQVLGVIHEGSYAELRGKRMTHAPEVEKEKSFLGSLFTRENMKQSVKTVIIIMLLLLGEKFFNLPGSSQASFYGVLFGSMPNTGQAHLKGRLAIIGVVAGLAYGLFGLVIVSQTSRFLILILLFCLGLFVAAYVATGSRRIAYSGVQAGLMIPYVFLVEIGPEVNLDLAFTRLCALLAASAIGLVILHNLWPVSPYEQLKKKISYALGISGEIFARLLTGDRKDKGRIESLVTPLAASLPTSSSLLFDARFVIGDERLHGEEFVEIIASLEMIFSELETIKKTVYSGKDTALLVKYIEHMAPSYEKISAVFHAAASGFDTGDDLGGRISGLIEEIKSRRQEFRESGVWKRFTIKEVEQDILMAGSVDGILDSLSKISSLVSAIERPERGGAVTLAGSGAS